MLQIDKSKSPLSVICTRDGYYPNFGTLKANFQPMLLGNILLGGVIGIVVDSATGADSKYDASVKVDLKRVEQVNLDKVLEDIKRNTP